MSFMEIDNSASLLIFTVAIGLTLVIILMYFLWQKYYIVKRRRSQAYETNFKEELNVTTVTMSRHMSIPTEIKTEARNPPEPFRNGSVTPPPPARSFSGQFDIKKISPSMRHLSKINSQIIMFNGQPHIHSQLHRRFSKAEIIESSPR